MIAQGLVLQVRAAVSGDKAKLTVEIDAKNALSSEIYWLNRFFRAKAGGAIEWDPRGPYRFEQAGALRLLYGPAPVPKNSSVSSRFIPHATRIEPGASVKVVEELPLPVEEFALFEPARRDTQFDLVEATRLAVLGHYVEPGQGVTIEPSTLDPKLFVVKAANQRMILSATVQAIDPIQVRRRKDDITRIAIPGEDTK